MTDVRAARPLGRADLLILFAIFCVVLALLLAAILRSRETSQRTFCQNNLRRIGMALQSYHDRTGRFPPGYTSYVASDGTDLGPGWGWGARLLADLEQASLMKLIDFKRDVRDPSQQAPRTCLIAVFQCPTDRPPTLVTVRDARGRQLAEVAHANYIAMNGNNGVSRHAGRNDGPFLRNRAFRSSDIVDGLAQTIFVGERSSDRSLATWVGVVADGVVPPRDGSAYPELAPALVLGHAGVHLPNHPTVRDLDAFASCHPAGVNFLFGDGAVRTIPYTIAPHVYDALATRAGQEPVDLNEL